MPVILLDIILGLILYCACLLFFIMREKRQQDRDNHNDEGDDEGGLPVSFPPDFDLPPGVCLPDDPRAKRIIETEEIFA